MNILFEGLNRLKDTEFCRCPRSGEDLYIRLPTGYLRGNGFAYMHEIWWSYVTVIKGSWSPESKRKSPTLN